MFYVNVLQDSHSKLIRAGFLRQVGFGPSMEDRPAENHSLRPTQASSICYHSAAVYRINWKLL